MNNNKEKKKKVVFIAPKTFTFLNFRGRLMTDIIKKGYEVVAIVPEDGYDNEFKDIGARKIILKFNKTSLSPFSTLKYLFGIKKILEEEKPNKVFSYTMKPVICGSIAAHLAQIEEIYSLVCGLGIIYAVDSFKNKILRFICGIAYKIAFKYNTKVIFQNKDDIDEFIKRGYLKREKTTLVNGSGVDLKIFKKNNLPDNNSFIMVSRIIREKGVREYFEAAKIIKNKYPKSRFAYIGAYDKSYKKDFEVLKKYIDEGIVEYIPETNDVPSYVSKYSIFVLPSYYREGIPKTLLEATAMGRPIITTNTPGCKETIIDGINGYFVNIKDKNDLVEKMEKMIKSKNLQKMGDESYKICLEKFDINIINKNMMEVMKI